MLSASRVVHIVDFAGGTGAVGIPLAAVLPHSIVTIVDMNTRSLEIALARASSIGLSNVRTWAGGIAAFTESFDLGVALHACGEASDLSMDVCIARGACFIISPCCTGKL